MAKAGRVELAVRRDIRALPASVHRGALAELAYVLARAIDGRKPEQGVTMTAKLVAELRLTLRQLHESAPAQSTDEDLGTPEYGDAATTEATDEG